MSRPLPVLPDITHLQSYFPALEVLFPSLVDHAGSTVALAASELCVDVSGNTATIEHMMTHERRDIPIWFRKTHIVEPIAVMSGEYVLPADGALPANRKPWQHALSKINEPYNEAYTDAVMSCMASRLVETGRSPHFCRFFGTYNGRTASYRYNITEDMADIEGEEWFRNGLKAGAFRVIASDAYEPDITAEVTRPWENIRRKLHADSADHTSDCESGEYATSDVEDGNSIQHDVCNELDVTGLHIQEQEHAEIESVSTLEDAEEIPLSGEAQLDRPRVQLTRLSGDRSDAGSEDTESDVEYTAVLPNFPVQVTLIERGEGTMDELMDAEFDSSGGAPDMEPRWTAWIFQVIAGLTVAQSAYDFVHNDLHAGNVLWTTTDEPYLYYHIRGASGGDRYYRVPTYGRIMKIIDFGRATFRPPTASKKKQVWISDAYAPAADAGGQYNCAPYYQQGEPRVLPNKSFDLCRLAVALFDTLWPHPPAAAQPARVLTEEPGRTQHETVSPLWNLLWMWLTDIHGRNININPDGSERYPNFNLYCAIARNAKNAVPSRQVTLPLFDASYRIVRSDIPAGPTIWDVGV